MYTRKKHKKKNKKNKKNQRHAGVFSLPRGTTRKSQQRISKSHIRSRDSTLYYEAIKQLADFADSRNVPFTADDHKMKEDIWGCKLITIPDSGGPSQARKRRKSGVLSSFSDEICGTSATGDHIYGLRELPNIIGSNSPWNLIPCTHSENVSWKKVTINLPGRHPYIKNIVADTFSPQEIEALSKVNTGSFDSDYNRYIKFITWKNYVDSRGAKMFYIGRQKFEKYINKTIIACLNSINLEIEQYFKHLERGDSPMSAKYFSV
jgi:hypothetical protein